VILGVSTLSCRGANELLTCAINNIEYGGVAAGCWELLNEVEGD
jgi:hypothetical protein